MGFLLVLVYALYRWGSGREVAWGSLIALTAATVGLIRDHTSIGDSLLGFLVLTIPAAIGATVRFWSTTRAREIDQARLLEREQLARELHDTVAHHVSAMVIRAQAGRVVAATSPEAAVEALAIIETEGSRTLAEMRSMVGALRQGDDVELAPAGGPRRAARPRARGRRKPCRGTHVRRPRRARRRRRVGGLPDRAGGRHQRLAPLAPRGAHPRAGRGRP